MGTVGLKPQELNEYVRIAAAGETAQVTDGNRIVAELAPDGGPSNRSLAKKSGRKG